MKILVNLVNLTQIGILSIWLKKFQEFNKLDNHIDIFCNGSIFEINIKNQDIYKFNQNFKLLKKLPFPKTKIGFMFFCLIQNLKSLFFLKKIKNKKYDIIYSPSSVLDLVIIPFLLKITNKKLIWSTVFDNTVPFSDPGNSLIRFLAWVFFQISLLLLKKADLIFAISSDLKEFLIKKGFKESKIIITGNAIENDLIKKSKPINNLKIDALFIGRINETKGIYDMLKILKIVKQKYPKFVLGVMGKGDDITVKQFTQKIVEEKLENNILFLGYKTGIEKFNFIKSSKCFWFLSVSKSESFGISLLEAVCCGLPAFTYDLRPFKQIYKNNEIIMSKKGDYKSVAQKVIKLFDNKDFDNKNGKKLLGKFTWGKIIKKEFLAINKLI